MNSERNVSLVPLTLFIDGWAEVGKSHWMKTISIFLTKYMNRYSGSTDKPKVPIAAPTGPATININGTTITSGLMIKPFRFRNS